MYINICKIYENNFGIAFVVHDYTDNQIIWPISKTHNMFLLLIFRLGWENQELWVPSITTTSSAIICWRTCGHTPQKPDLCLLEWWSCQKAKLHKDQRNVLCYQQGQVRTNRCDTDSSQMAAQFGHLKLRRHTLSSPLGLLHTQLRMVGFAILAFHHSFIYQVSPEQICGSYLFSECLVLTLVWRVCLSFLTSTAAASKLSN